MIRDYVKKALAKARRRALLASASTWLDRYYDQQEAPVDAKKELNALRKEYDNLTTGWLMLDGVSEDFYKSDAEHACSYFRQNSAALLSRENRLKQASSRVYERLSPADQKAYKAMSAFYQKRLDAVHALADAYAPDTPDTSPAVFKQRQSVYERDPRRFKAVSEVHKVAEVGKMTTKSDTLSDYRDRLDSTLDSEDDDGKSLTEELDDIIYKPVEKLQADQKESKQIAKLTHSVEVLTQKANALGLENIQLKQLLEEQIRAEQALLPRVDALEKQVKQPEQPEQTEQQAEQTKQPDEQQEPSKKGPDGALLARIDALEKRVKTLEDDKPKQTQYQQTPTEKPAQGLDSMLQTTRKRYAKAMMETAGYKSYRKINTVTADYASGKLTEEDFRKRVLPGIYRGWLDASKSGKVDDFSAVYQTVSNRAFDGATGQMASALRQDPDFVKWCGDLQGDAESAKAYQDKQRAEAKAKEAEQYQDDAPLPDAPPLEADDEYEM